MINLKDHSGAEDIINKSITYWTAKQNQFDLLGDMHGKQSVALLLSSLETIRDRVPSSIENLCEQAFDNKLSMKELRQFIEDSYIIKCLDVLEDRARVAEFLGYAKGTLSNKINERKLVVEEL